jgi:hypothetical protein
MKLRIYHGSCSVDEALIAQGQGVMAMSTLSRPRSRRAAWGAPVGAAACFVLLLVVGRAPAETVEVDALGGEFPRAGLKDLRAAAKQALRAIKYADATAVARVASKEGVIVVGRWMDWEQLRREPSAKEQAARPIRLPGADSSVWVEQEVRFVLEELRGSGFRRVLEEFRRNMGTPYHHSVRCELALRDHWGVRCLGPAAEGKVCSNFFWYLCFTREAGRWRLYRMEIAAH